MPGTRERDSIYFLLHNSRKRKAHSFSIQLSCMTKRNKEKPFQIGKQRHLKFVPRAEKNVQNKRLVGEVDRDDTEMRYAETE